MPTFTPTTYDLGKLPEEAGHGPDWSLWRYFRDGIAAQYVVIITGGVANPSPGYASPSVDQFNNADSGSGENGKAIFRGGETYTVTDGEKVILIAAGYDFNFQAVNWTYSANETTTARPTGGQNEDTLIILVMRNSAWEFLAAAFSADGFTRDHHDEEGGGDPRSMGWYSKKVTNWAGEPASYVWANDGKGLPDHTVVLLIRNLRVSGAHFRNADAIDYQSVAADFDCPSNTSVANDMVIRWWYAEQTVAQTTALNPGAEAGILQITPPTKASAGSAEIWLHRARVGTTTGTFTIDFLNAPGPEIFGSTAVYIL